MKIIFYTTCLFLLSACSHHLTITPNNRELKSTKNSLVNKRVGYVMSDQDLNKKEKHTVMLLDTIVYYPNEDWSFSLEKILFEKFIEVYPLKTVPSAEEMKEKKLDYLFIPKISSYVTQTGFLTWPPTGFAASIALEVKDQEGKNVYQNTYKASVYNVDIMATRDVSLAPKLAALDLFTQLLKDLDQKF